MKWCLKIQFAFICCWPKKQIKIQKTDFKKIFKKVLFECCDFESVCDNIRFEN